MSINDPIIAVHNAEKNWWYLMQGNETFYDESRSLRVWKTKEDALAWAKDHVTISTPIKHGQISLWREE